MSREIAITLIVTITLLSLLVFAAAWRGDKYTRRTLFAHLLLYGMDFCCVLIGLTLGFGLEVKSWFFVLAPALWGRLVLHIYNGVFYNAELARRRKTDKPQSGDATSVP